MWVRKLDSNSLHPLWPQNKWLHTLQTADYRHTRQDRWIQTELVFTLAKNATKPNPFKIIPLQTTRKENNWKTEALVRAAVTLETERIKGSNPWCLWWKIWSIGTDWFVKGGYLRRALPLRNSIQCVTMNSSDVAMRAIFPVIPIFKHSQNCKKRQLRLVFTWKTRLLVYGFSWHFLRAFF
jgi:hypothetical protein